MEALIHLEGIRRRFEVGPVTLDVLRGVSLTVRSGELVAIMGASGSGKTVLLNILGLLDAPDEGRHYFAGREVAYLDDDERTMLRNRMVGFVFQHPLMLPRLTAAENVAMPLLYRRVRPKQALARARKELERVGLGDRAQSMPYQLSGGQLQRVAIARAFVGEPDVILADEPTAALDALSAEGVLSTLFELNRTEGVTVVLVTHEEASAAQCSRRCMLDQGVLASAAGEVVVS